VDFAGKAAKQAKNLPPDIRDILYFLVYALKHGGPDQPSWRNYGKLTNARDVHHCHLNNNRPRFVGPHGSVDYGRFK
jgi:hypothetical protein